MTNNNVLLTSLRLPTSKRFVRTADGNRIAVVGIGQLGPLRDVLYVPGLQRNLISVSSLTRAGHELLFRKGDVLLDGAVLGRLSKNLYVASPSSSFMSSSTDALALAADINSDDFAFADDRVNPAAQPLPHLRRDIDLLHRRYGHADIAMIKRLVLSQAVTGLAVSDRAANPNLFHCEACSMSKAVKQPRVPSRRLDRGVPRARRDLYFTAVYSDVLGPIQPVAVGGFNYGVTFTDVTSRYRYFFPLRQKSDVLTAFQSVVAEVTALGFNVRLLRSDNGGEYQNEAFAAFCRSALIDHRFNPPNTPQANSYSERFNRVLEERARSMMYGSKLPKSLWAECMATVTYLYNRSLTPAHPTMTPFELLFGVKPDVSHLRAHGCVTYMYNFAQDRSKLDNRALKGVLVGYDRISSSYLVYLPELKCVRRSGHCSFNEHALYYTDDTLQVENTRELQLSLQAKLAVKTAKLARKSFQSSTSGRPRSKKVKLPTSFPSAEHPTASRDVASSAPDTTTADAAVIPSAVDSLPAESASISPPIVVTDLAVPALSPSAEVPTDVFPPAEPSILPSAQFAPVNNNFDFFQSSRWNLRTEPTPSARRSKRSRRDTEKMAALGSDRVHFVTGEIDFSEDELVYLAADSTAELLTADVPASFRKLASRPDAEEWLRAVESENASLRRHGVLIPVDHLPPGKNLIKAKFIFKLKSDGRYKVRLVAKGYSQQYGIDYTDVFAPVVSKNSLRALLALAAAEDFEIHQMDVETAFLHGELEEELYIEAPEGSDYPKGTVLRLAKSLYGLKQAPRQWNKALHSFITSQGFRQSVLDTGVYYRGSGSTATYLAVYVDDLLIFGHDLAFISAFKSSLNSTFKIKDLGEVSTILGMEVKRDRSKRLISLSQTPFLRSLVTKYLLNPDVKHGAKSVPITKSMFKTAIDGDNSLAANIEGIYPYRSALGAILYANTCSRPDISFAVSSLAGHCSNPKKMHWLAIMDLLRYISDTQDLSITYGGRYCTNQIELFADADFSKHPDIRRSRSGFVLFLNGGPIAWNSSLQKRTAMSTTESELYAMYDGVQQAIWFREFLAEIGFPQAPTQCYEDNSGLLDWINNNKSSSRMKSIPRHYYKLREFKDEGQCVFIYCPTAVQKADILTKQMDYAPHSVQVDLMFNL